MPSERQFIAIPLPVSLRDELTALYESGRNVAWTRVDQLHLTIRFLGDVDSALGDAVDAALAQVRIEPFLLALGGVGVFPPRGPARVIWVGIGRSHPRLSQLRQRVDDALLATGLPLDVRVFHPHVTLGRVRNQSDPGATIEFFKRHRDFDSAPFRVDAFQLFASELRPAGAVHTLKREFRLTGPA